MDPEKQRLTLHIGSHSIVTTIRRKDEESLKRVESELNNLWKQWRVMNPSKEDDEVLAMVAFQFAKLYYDTVDINRKREDELLKFIKEYEKKLNDVII